MKPDQRPSPVTTLLWMVLCLTAWNTIRLGASIVDWDVLLEFAPHPGPLYITLSAAFWTLAGLALWTALRRQSLRARSAAAAFAIGYTAWWWMDRLLLQAPRPNGLFAAVASVLLLMFSTFLLYHPHTKEYFRQRERHEQTPSDQHPA
jgi:hypothetical protein